MNKKIKKISSLVGLGIVTTTTPLALASCSDNTTSDSSLTITETLSVDKSASIITSKIERENIATIKIINYHENEDYLVQTKQPGFNLRKDGEDWKLDYDGTVEIKEDNITTVVLLIKNGVVIDNKDIFFEVIEWKPSAIIAKNSDDESVTYTIPYSQENVDAFCQYENSTITIFDENNETQTINKLEITSLTFGSEWIVGLDEIGYNLNGNVKYNYLPDNFLANFFFVNSMPLIGMNFLDIDLSGLDNVIEVGNNFCSMMFFLFNDLTSLSNNFNLPQGIRTVGSNFCSAMFGGCVDLASLPEGFDLPQGITSVGNNFAWNMFANCTALYSPSEYETKIHIPNVDISTINFFCDGMFLNVPSTENVTNGTPDPGQEVKLMKKGN